MKVGIPKEIKNLEFRVALTPNGTRVLSGLGHKVYIEAAAGDGAGFFDIDYQNAGATILNKAEDIYSECDLILKVKEPLEVEYQYLRKNQVLFTYLHLAASMALVEAMLKSGCVGIAYETVELPDKSLPLLIPMSEIAGKMSVQVGARFLEKNQGGSGVLLGGVPGVKAGNVIILGGGIVGSNAAKIAAGMGANVTIMDTSQSKLRALCDTMPSNVNTLYSNEANIESLLPTADLIIGSVLIPGGKAPILINDNQLDLIKSGSVIVDVAVDQGGCIASSKVTSHQNPVYNHKGILHYGVPNMPGAVPVTSTLALTSVTLPYIIELANKGWEKATKDNFSLAKGINIAHQEIVFKPVLDVFENR